METLSFGGDGRDMDDLWNRLRGDCLSWSNVAIDMIHSENSIEEERRFFCFFILGILLN